MYDVGDVVTLKAVFGSAATAVTVDVRKPDGTLDSALTATDSGDHKTWTYDYTPAAAGPYWYRFAGTGAVAAQEGTFTVRAKRAVASSPVALWVLSREEALNAIAQDGASMKVNLDTLDLLIAGASRMLDRKCGPVVIREQVDHLDGGRPELMLRRRPVDSVTSVVEWRGNTSVTLTQEVLGSATTSQYQFDERTGQLWRRESACPACFYPGLRNIVVTYDAGRAASTADVDEQFKQAAGLTVANVWRREFGMHNPDAAAFAGATFALPNAARELLAGELLMDFGVA